jgi:hypothetical protein
MWVSRRIGCRQHETLVAAFRAQLACRASLYTDASENLPRNAEFGIQHDRL